MPVALVTGGSAGLGRALTHALADAGWDVLTDGRRAGRLAAAAHPGVEALAGDIADEDHRHALARWVDGRGGLDLLVHNASTLGPLPMRPLRAAAWTCSSTTPARSGRCRCARCATSTTPTCARSGTSTPRRRTP